MGQIRLTGGKKAATGAALQRLQDTVHYETTPMKVKITKSGKTYKLGEVRKVYRAGSSYAKVKTAFSGFREFVLGMLYAFYEDDKTPVADREEAARLFSIIAERIPVMDAEREKGKRNYSVSWESEDDAAGEEIKAALLHRELMPEILAALRDYKRMRSGKLVLEETDER